jgi:hypothetical protein
VPSDLYGRGTVLISLALIALGVAIVARTLDAGGGPLSIGIIIGVLFLAAGAGRLWVVLRGDRG